MPGRVAAAYLGARSGIRGEGLRGVFIVWAAPSKTINYITNERLTQFQVLKGKPEQKSKEFLPFSRCSHHVLLAVFATGRLQHRPSLDIIPVEGWPALLFRVSCLRVHSYGEPQTRCWIK